MWAAVNVLKSGSKISDPTKRHHKQLNLFDINGKLTQKCGRAGFISVLGTLTRWFPYGILKQDFYVTEVTTFFWRNNVAHIEDMNIIFFQSTQNFI